ncbi:host attachment protein [Crenothrix sp.]|uniref:host attachment protein n=1 Tax=Crenothrix sp. TaxID=3100433 RepID=UPI00374DA40A
MKLTWILVANSTHARIFTADTPSSALEEIGDLAHTEGRLYTRELTTDLPGRVKGGQSSRHALEQPTDPKKHEADIFAHQLAEHLEEAYNANKFKQLLIIAEPSFLGLLRQCLPEHIKKQVCLELDKNITLQSAADIRKHLPEYLPHVL